MPTQTDDLRDFHHFLGEKLNADGAILSPEEALDEWRRLHPEPQASAARISATVTRKFLSPTEPWLLSIAGHQDRLTEFDK